MSKLFRLVASSLFLISLSAYSYECGGSAGARHLNPGDEIGKPTGGFVGHSAKVDAGVYLGPYVEVCDYATVQGLDNVYPRIEGDVKIYGRAIVSGNVLIKDKAQLYGEVRVRANSREKIVIRERAELYGGARIFNNARIQGDAKIFSKAVVQENGRVC